MGFIQRVEVSESPPVSPRPTWTLRKVTINVISLAYLVGFWALAYWLVRWVF